MCCNSRIESYVTAEEDAKVSNSLLMGLRNIAMTIHETATTVNCLYFVGITTTARTVATKIKGTLSKPADDKGILFEESEELINNEL